MWEEYQISLEQFNEWKRSPVTEQLINDLTIAALECAVEDNSSDYHQNIMAKLIGQGYIGAAQAVIDWTPESVKKIKEGDAND